MPIDERRKYRFRAWHVRDKTMYPVVMVGRGGALIQQAGVESTSPLGDLKIMQYSGLLDVNGHEIYEGDIVEYWHGHEFFHKQVVFENGSFRLLGLSLHKNGPKVLSNQTIERYGVKVVGNIFELGNA